MQLKHLIKDRRGAAAVEFAFIAPVMILMYYGLAELTQGMMADRRASHVASAIGDLVAQDTVINTTEMNDIFNVGKAIIAPFPTSGLSMRVTSIRKDSTGAIQVVWSKSSGSMGVLSTVSSVPTGLIANNESVILAESSYVYNSATKKALPNAMTFTQKYYLKPRKTAQVTWSST
ncbi:MAG: pilus assembly protein [Phenylobacterium sp.]|uniref:TadE/TadG family type IV pilus assembly protein n=1 Tax=Phenylobacterium sp. TaxID=1871053 RepID=UPI001B528478|nr:TadE/TadG family type IV pilus assembly protein [Phenylobacterium sp.]MBP7816202.1 pilus assembly protein [Phenylobacterium sp.]MBP9232798.1 pilus assembly protein [Phenylobacterium sp.]MBP9755718.1 pilus assembly protein [Phenylobacterium sp.]